MALTSTVISNVLKEPQTLLSNKVKVGFKDFLESAHHIDQRTAEYLKGKVDIVDLSPEVAAFMTNFQFAKDLADATLNIPKTLLNIQV